MSENIVDINHMLRRGIMISSGKGLACICLISAAVVAATGCAGKDKYNENAHAQQSALNDETADEKNDEDLMKLSTERRSIFHLKRPSSRRP